MNDVFDRIASLSPKRLALLAHELNDELAREKERTRQPIAVIGLACRLPGEADDPEALWRLLLEGRDLIGPAPSDRWDLERPIAELGQGAATPQGGYLRQVDQFDPLFFGISPREAETMDPQQRLLLEVAWEALENAAIAPDSLRGTRTGVFIGIAGNDFTQRLLDQDVAELDSYIASGGSHAIAAGRLAYTLDLAGPCMSIDTACSSSLVSITSACDNLRIGRADLALAGGVSLILSPETTVILAKAGMLSPTFRCRSFDASADGFVRGEGCGVLVLKRLSDAERDGDRIMAVIRGVAVNQDGRSSGLTAPRGPAQQALLREAIADAGVEPQEVGYLETHGTGTSLGDPIEAQALIAVYGRDRAPGDPLVLGSLKANAGHLEAAAGVAGVIKMVLSLERGTIPPIPHLERPNPHVDWARSGLALPREATPWPSPRIGGVSSFGFSGTNAHLLLAEQPAGRPAGSSAPERSHHLFCLSAKTAGALRTLAARTVDHLERHPDILLEDICFTAGQGRNHHGERLAIVASDTAQLRAKLAVFAASPPKGRPTGQVPQVPSVAFLFTGQGSQYRGMARSLYETEPAFAATLDECSAVLIEAQGVGLKELLYGEDAGQPDRLNQTGFTQPALFALEVALAQLLVAWGVQPAAALGHSVGEFAAACVAGVFSLSEGMTLIVRRAALMQALPAGGGMAAVLGKEEDVRRALRAFPGLSIAGLNGPTNVVVSGPLPDLDRLLVTLETDGIPAQKLAVSHAFHSALLDPMLGDLARAADRVSYGDPRLPVMSNLTGRRAQGDDLRSGTYWRSHARQPVRFTEGMQALSAMGCTAFVEIGPSPVLTGMSQRFITDPEAAWLPTLRPGRPDLEQLFGSLGELYVRGVNLDFAAMNRGRRQHKVVLPSYPFERSRYWPATKPRAHATAPTTAEPWADWLYEFEWRESLDPAAALASPPTYIPPTGDLRRNVDARVDAWRRDNPASDDAGYRAIDELCRDYIVEALEALGCELQPGDRFATETLRRRLGIADRHTRLFARLLAILAEDGVLTFQGGHWTVVRRPEAASRPRQRDIERDHPHFAAEMAVLASCGPELAAVLQGRCDPMQLLFPAGGLGLTTRLYSEPRPMIVFNGLIEACVGDIVERLPRDRTLRVLEVGAGSGGTAARVLPRLPPDRASYLFTDVSPQFLDRARDRFKAFPFVEYGILNLENPPSELQGFVESFDIIIAANVVHATRDLRRTLTALGRMLKPEGLLVLLEVVQPQRMGDLTVGMTDGWWAFTDHDIRHDYPLVSREGWVGLLEQAGFVTPLTAPHDFGADERMLADQTIVLARRPAQPAVVPERSDQAASGRWLILADGGGVGGALGAALRARGGECVLVERGRAYRELGPDAFEIDPLASADYERVLRAFQSDGSGCRGVVYLWGLDAGFEEDADTETVLAAVKGACGGALMLVQSMARAAWTGGLLTVVTRGGRATALGEAPAHPAQAALWSMAGVVALEHPALGCRRIQLERGAGALQLSDELLRNAEDASPVSLTATSRRTLRLHRSPAREAPAPVLRLRPDAAYLVTGGFTGLGLQTARWLAEHGAGQLVLVGRRPPGPEAERVIADLSRAGAAPLCLQADVGDAADLERVFGALSQTGLDLAGVVHSAGALSDGALVSLTWRDFERTMRAKVEGAWALHRHTRGRKLDFFVLYSSGSSVLGSIGQANHAAANGFLDALAFHRRGSALPALSINWGPWREVGAAASHGVLDASRRRGVESIGPTDGLAVLKRLIGQDRVQVAVLPIDWTRFDPSGGDDASLFADFLMNAPATPAQRVETQQDDDWREKLRAAAPGRRRSVLAELLEIGATKTLRLNDRQSIESHVPLSELGLDSLMALQLRNELAGALQVDLAPTLLYNYPTLDALTDYLLSLLFADPLAAQIETATELDDLSEEELVKILEEQIELG